MKITWIERSDDGGATWRIYCQSVRYRGENIVLRCLLRDLKKYGGDEEYREEVA